MYLAYCIKTRNTVDQYMAGGGKVLGITANRNIQIIWIFRIWRINKSGYIEWNMDKRWIDRRRIYRRYRYIRQILGMKEMEFKHIKEWWERMYRT